MKIVRIIREEGFFHFLREGSLLVASRILEKVFDLFNPVARGGIRYE